MNTEKGPGWPHKTTLQLPLSWVSIDPGELHCGYAKWSGVECVETFAEQGGPGGHAVDRLIEDINHGVTFVLWERYTLYPQLARQQAGSEFLTSQQIGAMKLVCRLKGVPWEDATAGQGKRPYSLEPWRSWPQRQWRSYGKGPHAKDAECHGYAFLLRQTAWYPGKDMG